MCKFHELNFLKFLTFSEGISLQVLKTQTGKTTIIRLTAVRETSFSRYHGGPNCESPLWNPSYHHSTVVFRVIAEGPRLDLNYCKRNVISRTADGTFSSVENQFPGFSEISVLAIWKFRRNFCYRKIWTNLDIFCGSYFAAIEMSEKAWIHDSVLFSDIAVIKKCRCIQTDHEKKCLFQKD